MTTKNDKVETSESLQRTGKWRRRAGLLVLSEIGLVIGSLAVFYVFLTVLTRIYFPVGLGLSADVAPPADASPPGSDTVQLEVSTETSLLERLFAGEILGIQRNVQRRGANSLTWSAAHVGETISENDAVQTFARSTALLKVNERSKIAIGQNSLIVFDRGEADPFVANRGSVLVMIEGELSGSLGSNDGSSAAFGVQLPTSELTLVSSANDDDVEFLITINDDQSTTVNLHGGSAYVTGRDNRRTEIGKDESLTIDSSGTVFSVSKLPPPPHSTGPDNGDTVTYRDVPETVEFSWTPVADADSYHIVVARDPDFSDRVVDDDVTGNSFRHGALGPGDYYWHVRSRAGWSQGQMSAGRRLTVVRDNTPPRLDLDPAPATVAAGEWRLSGRTDSNARLFVDDTPVTHDNGRISHPIDLEPGANIIVVRAIDAAGNLNYASISVNAK